MESAGFVKLRRLCYCLFAYKFKMTWKDKTSLGLQQFLAQFWGKCWKISSISILVLPFLVFFGGAKDPKVVSKRDSANRGIEGKSIWVQSYYFCVVSQIVR